MQLAQAMPPSTLKTRGGYQVSIPAGTDDVLVQLNNVEVLRVSLGTNMTIKTPGTLKLEANDIQLNATNNVTVKASSNLDVRASSAANLQAGSTLSLRGATVDVNQGALEIT
jgi:uncharacterized protein (DUF2345 family)